MKLDPLVAHFQIGVELLWYLYIAMGTACFVYIPHCLSILLSSDDTLEDDITEPTLT